MQPSTGQFNRTPQMYVPPKLTPIKARGQAPEEDSAPVKEPSIASNRKIEIPKPPVLRGSIRIPTPEEIGVKKAN